MLDPFYFNTEIPPHGIPLFDSHAHLQYAEFDQTRAAVIQRAKEAQIAYIVCVGTTLEDSRKAISLAQDHPDYIYATVGNHPYHANESIDSFAKLIEEHSRYVVAIGETGLDYFRSPVEKSIQIQSFNEHCLLAKQFDLPIIIHLREFKDCYPEAKNILLKHQIPKAIFHCFTGDLASAQEIWSHNWKTSFALNTFYPKNNLLKEIYDLCPPHLKLHETDAPFLPPHALRGTLNEPAYLKGLDITL